MLILSSNFPMSKGIKIIVKAILMNPLSITIYVLIVLFGIPPMIHPIIDQYIDDQTRASDRELHSNNYIWGLVFWSLFLAITSIFIIIAWTIFEITRSSIGQVKSALDSAQKIV